MGAVGFNSILLLLVILLFTTIMLLTNHQLANEVVGDDAVLFRKVEKALLDENVGAEGRKLLGRMEGKREKMEKVDVNGEMRKRRSKAYNSKEKRNHEDSGFVSLNSDYHPPRHHPPKNN
ncbi:hypothetical protein M5689_017000 [Euphorbia peplus]|nr:hypothetical protein M5689_017000 [Euphorbia peplus]